MNFLDSLEIAPLLLSLKLASVTTVGLLLIGIPLSYFLAFSTIRFKGLLLSLITLPIILPPTVIGFYFLLAFSPESVIGSWLLEHFQLRLVFSFSGLVISSIVYSLPFMVQPVYTAFRNIPKSYLNSLKLLGKSRWNALYYVLLPASKDAIITGAVLSFAHTLGEFGIVLMVGGNIPNQTRVASTVLYEYVETFAYDQANAYALILLVLSLLLLCIVNLLSQKKHD